MCGIAGYYILKEDAANKEIIKEMIASIRHRGPDDYGFEHFDARNKKNNKTRHNLTLANTRLSIIDLSPLGHQPMFSDDKSICLVFNGEIYNYIELREELVRKGYRFKSKSDTEVIIKAYEEYGVECLGKLNGMWGFALYDKRKNILFCSRDRLGEKPFYYYKTDDEFVFGSEIKAITHFPIKKLSVNVDKIMHNIIQGYRFVDDDNKTYFREINQLLPAEYLIIDLENNTFSFKKYWDVDLSKRTNLSNEKEIIARFKELLIDSVRIRLRSDVPYTFALSGGVDSSSIISIAKKILKKEVITFSAIYSKGNRYDEQEFIKATINDLKIKHYFIRPELGNFFINLKEMIEYHDEPICTVTFYSHSQIMKAIKDNRFKVVITGNGADEIVSGYYDHYLYNFYDLEKARKKDVLEHEIAEWIKNHNTKEFPKSRTLWEDFKKTLNNNNFLSPNNERYRPLFKKEYLRRFNYTSHSNLDKGSLLRSRMYNELRYEGVPVLMRAEDRNTMMYSIEGRVPYLDYRLVEFCYSLPLDMRLNIRDGIGKYMLRESMKGILNEKVRTRKEKVGFNAPLYEWMKNELKKEITELIDGNLGIYQLIKKDVLKRLWKNHLASKENNMMLFWNILNIEFFLRYAKEINKRLDNQDTILD